MLQLKNKKAISEMLAYVLLIVIALAIGGLVYSWTLLNIPKDNENCPEDVSLIIKNYACSDGYLQLNLLNKGLFDISGFYIRANNESGRARTIMLEDTESKEAGRVVFSKDLEPGKEYQANFSYEKYGEIISVEIEPFVLGSKIILCEESIISEEINCTKI
ncbi:hypothetical protein [Flavobacterium sp.]|uniref:hypothetical protein n=1 Tax=Flavobacterium sp. TaxID=239 RepID=UPI00262C7F03|nr:hypothetical protein [Flavobacterium sp.]